MIRFRRYTILFVVAFVAVGFSQQRVIAQDLDPRLVNYDISGQIRFADRTKAEERREKLVRFIWEHGLPKTRPVVTTLPGIPEELAPVKAELIAKVDLYTIEVSLMAFFSRAYVAYPKLQPANKARLAIVHAGHMGETHEQGLELGLKDTIERLLENGFIVAAMQMPLVNWNKDANGILPNGTSFEIANRSVAGHDELFAKVEPSIGALIMAFFLEPVVQVTNELLTRHPENSGLVMVGLSGGGWTTHFSAALDPRITLSVPVAGALPLYARPFSRGSKGDSEQEYPPILREDDSNNDGVLDKAVGACSWLEIFALGGIGPSGKRKQVQVINFDDSCCFNGPVYQTYSESLSKKVAEIGTGEWQVYVDRTHQSHLISTKTLDEVLMPMLEQLK